MKFLIYNMIVCLIIKQTPPKISHIGWYLTPLTYARHSWPFSSEESLACPHLLWHGALFIMVIFEDPWHALVSLPVLTTWVCPDRGSSSDLAHVRRKPPRRSLRDGDVIIASEGTANFSLYGRLQWYLSWICQYCGNANMRAKTY